MILLGSTPFQAMRYAEQPEVYSFFQLLKLPEETREELGKNKTNQTRGTKFKDLSLLLPLVRGFWNKDTCTHKSYILVSSLGGQMQHLSEKCLLYK